jgi:nucleotidyltransferase/DNA polymerase involved in DNA repair
MGNHYYIKYKDEETGSLKSIGDLSKSNYDALMRHYDTSKLITVLDHGYHKSEEDPVRLTGHYYINRGFGNEKIDFAVKMTPKTLPRMMKGSQQTFKKLEERVIMQHAAHYVKRSFRLGKISYETMGIEMEKEPMEELRKLNLYTELKIFIGKNMTYYMLIPDFINYLEEKFDIDLSPISEDELIDYIEEEYDIRIDQSNYVRIEFHEGE